MIDLSAVDDGDDVVVAFGAADYDGAHHVVVADGATVAFDHRFVAVDVVDGVFGPANDV